MRTSCSLFGVAIPIVLLCACTSSTFGQSVTLTLQNGNDGGEPFNTTAFAITNNAGAGVNLLQLSLTVGDTQYNFDQIYQSAEGFAGGNGTQTAVLLLGDRVQDATVTDAFTYGFTNFGPGVSFTGQWDIDNDNGDFNANARLVMFNNGAAPNAVLSLSFSDGTAIQYTFPDLPSQDTYTLVIPAPGASVLLAAGVFMASGRRRRTS